jgi:ATP-dependent protease ClpP protease subunit
MNEPQKSLSQQFPAGCFVGFNALIDRKAAEQLVMVCSEAVRNGYNAITLSISSAGGLLEHAYYAYHTLEALPVRLITHNIGSVQSAANLLFLCGDERYASEESTFFFHQSGFEAAPGQRMTNKFMSERLKAMGYEDERTGQIYSAKTARPIEEVREWMNTERVLDGDAAVKNGLIKAVRPFVIPPNAFYHQVII